MPKTKPKFNEDKYIEGIRLVVEQLALMIKEDECDECESNDYIADTFQDIQEQLEERLK